MTEIKITLKKAEVLKMVEKIFKPEYVDEGMRCLEETLKSSNAESNLQAWYKVSNSIKPKLKYPLKSSVTMRAMWLSDYNIDKDAMEKKGIIRGDHITGTIVNRAPYSHEEYTVSYRAIVDGTEQMRQCRMSEKYIVSLSEEFPTE